MTKFEIYNINSVQPDDFKELILTKDYPRFTGFQKTTLESDAPIRLKDDAQYLIRPIQVVYFPKYKIQFLVNGNYWIEQIEQARKINVIRDGETTQSAEILSFGREFLGADTYKVDVEYFDKATSRVVDNLKSEFIAESDQGFEYYQFQYSATDSIYTRIFPKNAAQAPEQSKYPSNDRDILTKSVYRKSKIYTFFLGEDALDDFLTKYHYYNCSVDGVLQADILPDLTVDQVGWDLYKLEIEFIYDIQKYLK